MRFLVTCLCALIGAASLALAVEESLTISRKVLMPDGTPAVGARVVIRSLGVSSLLQEIETKTGVDGVVKATVRYAPSNPNEPQGPHGATSRGYIMVDMPGCALAFGRLFGVDGSGGASGGPAMRGGPRMGPGGPKVSGAGTGGIALQLSPAYAQRGVVIDSATNTPVAGATVIVLGFTATVPANLASQHIATRELITVSGPDGVFTFRGVTSEVLDGFGAPAATSGTRASVAAYFTVDGKTRVGENRHFTFSASPQATPPTVKLIPAAVLEGTVLNAEDGAPVAGAKVSLEGTSDWIFALPSAVTNAQGVYRIATIPTDVTRIYAIASKDGWTSACARVYEKTGRMGQAAPMPETITPRALSISPLGPVTELRVVDAQTGQPALPALRVTMSFATGIFDQDLGWIGHSGVSAPVDAHGKASLRLPVGGNDLRIMGTGYLGGGTVTVPAQGVTTLQAARRSNGILVHFTGVGDNSPAGIIPRLRAGDGTQMHFARNPIDANGYWFFELRQAPAGPYQVQLMRDRNVLVPWTPIDPAVWPNEIAIQ